MLQECSEIKNVQQNGQNIVQNFLVQFLSFHCCVITCFILTVNKTISLLSVVQFLNKNCQAYNSLAYDFFYQHAYIALYKLPSMKYGVYQMKRIMLCPSVFVEHSAHIKGEMRSQQSFVLTWHYDDTICYQKHFSLAAYS